MEDVGRPRLVGGGSHLQSTRSMTGAEVVAPEGRSARQWYSPAWARDTWVKVRVDTGSACSGRPFQNHVKVELLTSSGPPGRWQLKFSAAPSGTSKPGSATTCTAAGQGWEGGQGQYPASVRCREVSICLGICTLQDGTVSPLTLRARRRLPCIHTLGLPGQDCACFTDRLSDR